MQQYNLRYFKPEEFSRCVPKCNISDMSLSFLQKLDVVRDYAGIVFKINSAYRSSDYDKSKGRSGKGFHTLGRAVDIDCRNSVSRAKIIEACLRVGLSCGVSSTFIHIDDRDVDEGYLDPIVFLY